MATVTIDSMVKRWAGPGCAQLGVGQLISSSGLCCAQGDVLRCSGYTDEELRYLRQSAADRRVAELLDISVGNSILLRVVRDGSRVNPAVVFVDPTRFLGPHASLVLEFWHHCDALGVQALRAIERFEYALAPESTPDFSPTYEATIAARAVAGEDAQNTVLKVSRQIADSGFEGTLGMAALEVQGHTAMHTPFFFLRRYQVMIEELKQRADQRKASV